MRRDGPSSQRRRLLAAPLLAAAPLSWADARGTPALPPLESLALDFAGYLVTGAGATPIASAQLTAEAGGQRYRIVLRVESFLADLSYESEGRIDTAGLHPEHYTEARKIPFRSRRVKTVQFREADPGDRPYRREGDVLWVPPGAQDRVSLLFQYTLLARADPTVLSPGAERSIPFARLNEVAPSRWAAGPAERIRALDSEDATQGPLAHRVARVADAQATVDVAFWLWAGARRLPLILQFSENARSLRFVATAVR